MEDEAFQELMEIAEALESEKAIKGENMFENQEEGSIEKIIDDRAFSCSYCDKKFNRLHTLKEHEKIHTGDNLNKCSICEKTFASSGNLRKHSLRRGPTGPSSLAPAT